MQGGEAENQHNNRLEEIDELTLPTLAFENEMDIQEGETGAKGGQSEDAENEAYMQEKVTGVKRGQAECVENPCNGKSRRRGGIKRSLLDITPVSYEEYEDSWDLENQSKKCKKAANCLLASCDCRGESEPIIDEREDRLVHLPPDTVAELGRQAVTRDVAGAIPPALIPGPSSSNTGRYSNTASGLSAAATYASSNHTTDTVSPLHRKSGRIQSSWSKRVLKTMITLMLLLDSILKVEGNSDWRELAFKIQSLDCSTPAMINKLHLPDHCFIPTEKLPEMLAVAQPTWILGEEYVQPCNELYPRMVKSTTSGWISISTRVLQVKTPAKMKISSSYKHSEILTTLYTMEELENWENYQQLPSFQKSQHQRLLNGLCRDESCSYGGHSAMAGKNLEDFKKHIPEGSEAMLASLNPFSAVYCEIEHWKTFFEHHAADRVQCINSFSRDKRFSVRSHNKVRSSDYEDDPELGSSGTGTGTSNLKCWKSVSV